MVTTSGTYMYTLAHDTATSTWKVVSNNPDVCCKNYTHIVVVCTTPAGFSALDKFAYRSVGLLYDGTAGDWKTSSFIDSGTMAYNGVYGISKYATMLSSSSILSLYPNLSSTFLSAMQTLHTTKVDSFLSTNLAFDWPNNTTITSAAKNGRWLIFSIKSPMVAVSSSSVEPEIPLWKFIGTNTSGFESRITLQELDTNINLSITCNKHS